MALNVKNTNYSGEVLETLLTLAATGNEIVEKGLLCVIPNINKAVSIPRIKSGKMLQKRNKNPQLANSKGDFDYSEKQLEPHDMMAFTVFDPIAFEAVWRPFQPKADGVPRTAGRSAEQAAGGTVQTGDFRAGRPVRER